MDNARKLDYIVGLIGSVVNGNIVENVDRFGNNYRLVMRCGQCRELFTCWNTDLKKHKHNCDKHKRTKKTPNQRKD